MSSKMSLSDLQNASMGNNVPVQQVTQGVETNREEVVVQQQETFVPQETTTNEQTVAVTPTQEGEDVRELHSSTPHSSLDNIAKLIAEKEAEARELEELAQAKEKEEKLGELVANKGKAYNDTVVYADEEEVKEDKEASGLAIASTVEKEEEIYEDASLSQLKIIKFKKEDQYKSRYDKILAMRREAASVTAAQAVLINSGYAGKFSAFKSTELLQIEAAMNNYDAFSAIEFQYKKIHEHLADTSVGKMDFMTFLKATSLLEVDSIFYALFCSTYPDVNEYPGTCTHSECKSAFTFNYPNKELIYLEDEDRQTVAAQISEILTSSDPAATLAESNTSYTFRKKLSNGTVVDFRHPTLYNQLIDTLEEMKKNDVEDEAGFANLLPFIDNILVEVEEGAYMELPTIEDKLQELGFISDEDFSDIVKIINKIQSAYKIKYGFKNLKCPKCKRDLPNQQIGDMASMLFIQHRKRTGMQE